MRDLLRVGVEKLRSRQWAALRTLPRLFQPYEVAVAMTETRARVGIPEDLDHDPTFARQRRVAKYLLGIAINRCPLEQPERQRFYRDHRVLTRNELIAIALREGIVEFTPWHHAPTCPSNDWSKTMLPEGPCTCGAERQRIRLKDR
jgi:hypothetical protein